MNSSNINQAQAQSFVKIFTTLGEAFKTLSNTSIIPKELLEEKGNEDKKTEEPVKDIKSKRVLSNEIDIDEERDLNVGNMTNISGLNESISNDNDNSDSNSLISVNENSSSKSNNNKGLGNKSEYVEPTFMDEQGWQFKLQICELSIEMGPFISQKKARTVIRFLKKCEPLMKKMPIKERMKWLKNLSDLIEQLIV
jgi:hypothetical protein